jgi:hypothetical protein
MESWQGWPLERLMYLFLGAAYLLVWMQMTLYHWKGAFRSKVMWGPVLFTPIVVIVSLAHGFVHGDTIGMIFVAAFAIAALEGLIGTFLHLKGVAAQVGGLNLRNLAAGPPFILAIIFMALGILGILIHYWPTIAGGTP